MRCFCILIVFLGITEGHRENFHIGVIITEGDEVTEKIIDNVLWKFLSNGQQQINYLTIKEKVLNEEAFYYHAAVCRLLKKGIGVFLTPTAPSSLPILAGYSNEYNLSLISPSLLETPQDPKAEDLMPKSAVGIEPSTTRTMLDLIRDLRWQEIVYIYDHDYGPEKLQKMFRIGYQALHLKLLGFAKVKTAKEAIHYLRSIESPGKSFRVILDTDLDMTRDLLQLHVHHTGVRKKNYHFIISRPVLETFWMQHEFGALKITGFLALTPNLNRFNNVKGEWMKLLGHQSLTKEPNLSILHYFYHDAAQFLSQAVRSVWHRNFNYRRVIKPLPSPISDCLQHRPTHDTMLQILKKVKVEEGLSGRIEFSEVQESRINVNLTIVQSTPSGYREIGSWSDLRITGGFRRTLRHGEYPPGALPQIASRSTTLRITTLISPPYIIRGMNGSLEGYCKDMIDIICEHLQKQCELHLVADGTYGKFDPQRGRWSGMIGEIIDGTADIALGDLIITGSRQRVVEFTDPFDMVSMSVVLKNPKAVGESMFFVFTTFTADVWICIVVATILFCLLFHGITKFTGAPDSIESASGIWGRKNAITMNGWFTIGSSMMQGTGAYPRSISSRLLTAAWWSSTTIFTCMYIASLTAQLQIQKTTEEKDPQFVQLKTLSLESILLESLSRGWPKIGVIYPSSIATFIKRSNLPLYTKLDKYFEENPDLKAYSDISEGIDEVRQSDGGKVLLVGSTQSNYVIRQAPCDLVAAQDSFGYAGYGIALSPQLHPTLAKNISDAVTKLHDDGLLGQLHRNWWIESSQCKNGYVHETSHGTLYSVSGAICVFFGLIAVVLVIFAIQFSRRMQDKESRRQQLTFDDMNLDHRLPTPPPELLSEPPPVLNVPEIENRTISATSGSESFKDFFERMRSGP